jgi:hypothetical protein
VASDAVVQSYDTKLSGQEELKFGDWKQKYAPRDSGADYDLRGAFKAGLTPDPKTGHWPDTYKKPNHPTFSNESQYAKYGNPGRWEGEKFIPASTLPPGFVLDKPGYTPPASTLPPGFVLDGGQAQEEPSMLSHAAHTAVGTLYSVPEAATNLASRAAAGMVSLGAGAAGAILPGEEGQAKRYAEKVGGMLPPYEPRYPQGKALVGALDVIPNAMHGLSQAGGEKVADITGSPRAGALTEGALDLAPSIVSRGASGRVAKYMADAKTREAEASVRESVKDKTWAEARKEGFVVPPSAVQGSFTTNRLESIGGKAAVGQQASVTNQETANKLGRRAASLGKDEPLTSGNFKTAREKLAAPYEEVARLSPSAGSAWNLTRESRRLSQLEWAHYKVSRDPAALARAQAHEADAAFYEQYIEAEASNLGKPELVAQLRKARMKLAQNYDVENATNLGDGNVSLRDIGKMYDKRGENAMTGELGIMGRFANAFYPYTQEGAKVPTPGVSKSEALASLGLGMGGYAAGGWPGMAAAAIPLTSHLARPLVLSKAMQPTRNYGPGPGLRAADVAARNPYAFGAVPAIGLRTQEQ